MTGTPDDDRLLELLAQALEHQGPLTDRAREAAYAAFTWRTIDAELAALSYDSAMELSTGARSDEVARQLTFATDRLEIEVMVAPEGPRLVGQLVPPVVAAVTLTRGDESIETTSDDLGRFGFDLAGSGPTKISVARGPGEPPVETEWVVL